MPRHSITLHGPGAQGRIVNGTLLRDFLALVIDGSQRAVRLRTEGRSAARGNPPAWIAAAAEFKIEIKEGSSIVEIDAPTLFAADSDSFAQRSLFPEVNPDLTSFEYFTESVAEAINRTEESPLIDKSMARFLQGFDRLFKHGLSSVEFAATRRVTKPLRITAAEATGFGKLEKQIPAPQQVRVAGKLDSIRHSDRTFQLLLPTKQTLKGIADDVEPAVLKQLWGSETVVAGTAYFNPTGNLLRIEAELVRKADEKDLQLWAFPPHPTGYTIPQTALRVPQGRRSGLNAVFGKWPGDEADDDVTSALEELS